MTRKIKRKTNGFSIAIMQLIMIVIAIFMFSTVIMWPGGILFLLLVFVIGAGAKYEYVCSNCITLVGEDSVRCYTCNNDLN